ncbi:hypothetical protein [Paraburkholderia sp. SIMBA_054]|uniref:hypothetical protein n=1 Tax=Paraburkholderia sp. SIMBA_054 TaxID=3085795 RepID=UPI00397ABA34
MENINDYAAKIAQEIDRFKEVNNVHDLPEIFHYWSNKHLLPMFQEFGISTMEQFFAQYLYEAGCATGEFCPRFISIGSGNCDLEIQVAKAVKKLGLKHFLLECLELNPHMLARGREMAAAEGMSNYMIFTEADFNNWSPKIIYAGAMANQSLHHVTNLESLFLAVKGSLHWAGKFVVADIIGRNGHQRWPEALAVLHDFWREMPDNYRYNQVLKRHEPLYENWDCSGEGFEGIRAQDILPLLLRRFDFEMFLGFANVVVPLIDRCFGHNFDAKSEWDRSFIDRVHAADEEGFRTGLLKPTQMVAVMTPGPASSRRYSRGISPELALRSTDDQRIRIPPTSNPAL